MRLNVAQAPPPSLSPPSSHNPSTSSSPSSSRLRPRFLSLSRPKSTVKTVPISCAASFDGHDFAHHIDENLTLNHTAHKNNKKHHHHHHLKFSGKSFRIADSRADVLEPSLLGIRPEPPDWPARDEVIRDCIARRASSIDLPLSLRIIKMKQRFRRLEEERGSCTDNPVENVNTQDAVSKLCCSTLYVIREVQSHALQIRGLVLDEDLSGVVSKVQREMTSSFVWIFREVFAKTPDLMLNVMLLTSNFACHSVENYTLPEKLLEVEIEEKRDLDLDLDLDLGIEQLELGESGVQVLEGMEEREVGLWNSMVREANRMSRLSDLVEEKIEFISPVKVEVESDDYEEYYRTDLLYQSDISQEPNNPLLLSNYAQFLRLVSRDYDRAEQCFKRAIQLDPTDAEIVSQYANFLWLVRKDLWRAEERFQQAMAAEPDNSYHASKYASFLWSTGNEDSCYPLDSPSRGRS